MIFCTVLMLLVSACLLIAPLRQLSQYFGQEEKRLSTQRRLSWRLRTFGALVRNENHPQHRLASQVAILSTVVVLTILMMVRIFASWR